MLDKEHVMVTERPISGATDIDQRLSSQKQKPMKLSDISVELILSSSGGEPKDRTDEGEMVMSSPMPENFIG